MRRHPCRLLVIKATLLIFSSILEPAVSVAVSIAAAVFALRAHSQ